MRKNSLRSLSFVGFTAVIILVLSLSAFAQVRRDYDGEFLTHRVGDLVIEPVYTFNDGPLREVILIDFAFDGTIFFAERRGVVNQLNPQTGERHELITIDVTFAGEQGLVGLALEPEFDFVENNYIYAFYTPSFGEGDFYRIQLSRFQYQIGDDGTPFIDPESEEKLHSVFNDQAGHLGGDIRFGPDGKLYIATADNSQWGYWSAIDRRPGIDGGNALRTSQNPLDLRGKILRLNPDGSIPEDNPFVGNRGGRAEVWAMGLRNPYRIHIDPVTGWVLIGDNAPDATESNQSKGPAGMVEYQIAWEGGLNFGWPICGGPNVPYIDYHLTPDSPTRPDQRMVGEVGDAFDCSEMTPALVWLTNLENVQFPALGSGAMSPVGGVILRAPTADAPYQWSEEYLNDWYIGDFGRGWVARIHLDGDGTVVPDLPNWYDFDLVAPDDYPKILEDRRIDVGVPATVDVSMFADVFHAVIDLRQSPDGALYVTMVWRGQGN